MNLGRFQQGQYVDLRADAVDPESAPVATITDENSAVVAVAKMPLSKTQSGFSLPILLGVGFPLGTYIVEYNWISDGVDRSDSDSFDVIHGGDIGGGVIAMYGYDRPEARYVVAQLSSGNLVQGRNPKF